jgi:hypothetical protein
MSKSSSRGVAATLAVSLGLFVAACGDDSDESSSGAEESASAEEVTLTADEYTFDLSATPTAETKEVSFDNQGEEFHVMIFARINEGFTLDEAVKLQGEKGSAETIAEAEAAPGKTEVVKVKKPIEPGEYAMLCPIGGPEGPHYKLGQLEEFSVE